MSAIKLQEGVYSVGVLNPSLRVFDIVMTSSYGTSYNAYLVTGEKNVLIETVHKDYFDQLRANVEEIIPLEKLDYLIMNHTEPDHSGSVGLLMERCPNLKLVSSRAAKKFLTAIANREFDWIEAKDGESLDLGNKSLRFISAPLLHWPDSMFTWDEKSGTLFTCDFLGAHYCEPTMRDTGILPVYEGAYEAELENYFNCIFGPFKPAVLDGLSKIPAGVRMVCPSHGPSLTEKLPHVMERYRDWATPTPKRGKRAAILYCSAYGCTAALAEAAGKALEADGWEVTSLDMTYAPASQAVGPVNEADVVLFGTPTINKNAPEAIWNAVHAVDAINTKGRSAGAFGAYGWSGEAPGMLEGQLAALRFKTPGQPFRVCFTPTQADLEAMGEFARSVAALAKPKETEKPKLQRYVCTLCGYIYDPAEGDPSQKIAPGTPFEELTGLWACPRCGVDKGFFEPVKDE